MLGLVEIFELARPASIENLETLLFNSSPSMRWDFRAVPELVPKYESLLGGSLGDS
jgi:hypothetical protein